jgi:hypothetical protein
MRKYLRGMADEPGLTDEREKRGYRQAPGTIRTGEDREIEDRKNNKRTIIEQ